MDAVGEIRPSQLMYTFGIGATLDLPEFSVLVLGLDFWDSAQCDLLVEPRLLAAARKIRGQQLRELRLPPVQDDNCDSASRGIPVVPFPRWMRCTRCGIMAPLEQGLFDKKEDKYHSTRYVHTHCQKISPGQKAPAVIPVRFLLACPTGHLSDVPWNEFVHDGQPCQNPALTMSEIGITGDASDIYVKCLACGKGKQLSMLVEGLRRDNPLFACSGIFPHLRQRDPRPCAERAHLMNLGASNLWFAQTVSVLSIPDAANRLEKLVRENWEHLEGVTTKDALAYLNHPKRQPWIADYDPQEVLAAIAAEESRKDTDDTDQLEDIKAPEWELLSGAKQLASNDRLELIEVDPPEGYAAFFEKGMLVPRLTEVLAMYGFTRISTQQELDLGMATKQKLEVAPLAKHGPFWLPAYETHGEGIFLRFREDRLQEWEKRPAVRDWDKKFRDAHRAWRKSRQFRDLDSDYPGIRFVLLHSFAHALMRQIVLDCGYTAASIRERIYCRTPAMPNGPMAGLLLYTAAPDSEGTLGGLVSLGNPKSLGRHVGQALENMGLCSSDPLCAEREPVPDGRGIHAAACHACLFSPETSCECGNRYLDRNVLAESFARHANLAFWRHEDLRE